MIVCLFLVECNCNSHSDQCMYSVVLGGGVCVDCQNGTTGKNCDMCKIGYYRNTSLSDDDPNICVGK